MFERQLGCNKQVVQGSHVEQAEDEEISTINMPVWGFCFPRDTHTVSKHEVGFRSYDDMPVVEGPLSIHRK